MLAIEFILLLLAYLSAAISLIPVLPFLSSWVQLVLLLSLVVGVIGDRRRRPLLANLPATLLACGFFVLFITQISFARPVTPLVQLLSLLLAVRLASDKSPRHILQLFLLAMILLAASSLLTLDMAYLVYLVLLILLVTSGLVLLSFYASDPRLSLTRNQWRQLIKALLVLPVGSLLLMLMLFMILPRTQTPLWDLFNPRNQARIGFSDQVKPGSVAQLAASGKLAFRAETVPLPATDLYWRGLVLNHIKGQTWMREGQVPKEIGVQSDGTERRVRIFAESRQDGYLVTLDRPYRVAEIRSRLADDGVARGRSRSGRVVNYLSVSRPGGVFHLQGSEIPYLQLPDKISTRLRDLADRLGGSDLSRAARLAGLQDFYLSQQFTYSERQLSETEQPVETFLFESKRGYCEYFASSFALLLRLTGVPARLVGGYLGGEYNHLGGYYLVGEDLAHVWVEALDDQNNWVRIDPSRFALGGAQIFQQRGRSLSSLQLLTDALFYSWNRLVISYDLGQQIALFKTFRSSFRDLKSAEMPSRSLLGWAGLLLLIACLLWWKAGNRNRGLRLVGRYRRQMADCCGVAELPASLGLFDLARRSKDPRCEEFARIYGGALYRGLKINAEERRRLRQIIRSLKNAQFPENVAKNQKVDDNMISGIQPD